MIRALTALPEGPVLARVRGKPYGRAAVPVEHPHGQLVYTVAGDGSRRLAELTVLTPATANLPTLLALLPGSKLADVPTLLASLDPRLDWGVDESAAGAELDLAVSLLAVPADEQAAAAQTPPGRPGQDDLCAR